VAYKNWEDLANFLFLSGVTVALLLISGSEAVIMGVNLRKSDQ
jgi:hypothetical protein